MTKNTSFMLSILSLVKHANYLESEIHKLENLIKYAPDMIYWKDKNSIHLGCNNQFASAAGFENREDIIGKSDHDFPWRARADKYIADDKEVISTGIPKLNIEDLVTIASGKEISVISNKVPLKDSTGNIVGILSIATDITNQKQLEYELRSSRITLEELYILNNIIKYAPDMIYWKDKNSIHLGCNDQFASAAGFENREDVIGKSDRDFPWHDQAEKYNADDRDVIESGKSRLNIEDVMPFKNGKKAIVITNKVPLRNQEGTIIGVLGIATDITSQKKIENDLKIAKESAEAGERAKTEFIANMSHDIRTPLSGVVGLGGIVEKEIENPSVRAKVHDMVKSADELLHMLNEILDVVSLTGITVEDIHEEPFDLLHLVQSIVDLEQSSVDLKKIELIQSIDPKIPSVLVGDHKKIRHILLKLAGNAIKFTKNGRVNINITLSKKLNSAVQLLFSVTDTGIGISAESFDKIFELFYKITPSYKGHDKGHGIGLHIVKTYTELLGGKVSVESKLNEGSKFSFTLTLKIPDKDAKPQNITPQSLTARSEEPPILIESAAINTNIAAALENAPEILVVEDNIIALNVAQTLVSQAQCNPTPASDGETALELVKTQHFDLILSDIGLPGISGIELAQQIRQFEKETNKKSVPIVAITGHAEGKIHNECSAAGINEVFIKPIRPEILSEICAKFSLFGNNNNQEFSTGQSNITLSSYINKPNTGAIGLDLPNTEAELFEIDNQLIFDIASERKILGDNTSLLMQMLKDTINITIPEELSHLQVSHETNNWQTIANIAHKLKGGFLSISLSRAATACKYLERYHKTGKTELLEKLYQQVIKTLEITSNSLKSFAK